MIHDRESAYRLAGTAALRAGLDQFEPSLDAGIKDGTSGRMFGSTRPRSPNRRAYALGFELGRFFRFDWQFRALPSVADSAAIVRRLLETRIHEPSAERLKTADWFSWKAAAMELAGDSYLEAAAMTWHAAGRLPAEYAKESES